MLTREYPPDVYGGAGVHVEYLSRELRPLVDLTVHCQGSSRPGAVAHSEDPGLAGANAALRAFSQDLRMAHGAAESDLVHSHTWYANMAGRWAQLLYGVPHVLTAHSLEPRRPWKAEQLGGGYRLSSWAEEEAYRHADAIIAVSAGMRTDVLDAYPFISTDQVHVVHNGIDTGEYHPTPEREALPRMGVATDRPLVVFLGRITRQKGLIHLLRAAHLMDPNAQIVLCAGAPDTPAIAEEVAVEVDRLRRERGQVVWIEGMVPRADVVQLLAAASVLVCPSVYEPLGIVNLEAMACGTAVVASDVGGIPEVVNDGVTGTLVHYDVDNTDAFEAGLAAGVNQMLGDPALAARYGAAGRARAVEAFGWRAIAERTVEVYRSVGGS